MHIAKISAFLKLNSNKKNSFKRTVTMTRVCVAVSLSRKQFWSHFRLPNANEHVPVKWNAKRGSTSHGSRFPRDFLGIMLRSSLHIRFPFLSLSTHTLFIFTRAFFSCSPNVQFYYILHMHSDKFRIWLLYLFCMCVCEPMCHTNMLNLCSVSTRSPTYMSCVFRW